MCKSMYGLMESIEKDDEIKHNYGRMCQIIDNLYGDDE